MQPLIITAAICGAEVSRADTPYLPITPEELAKEAIACREAGAAMVHLHVRDKEGNATQSAEIFDETVKLIREQSDIIVQVSTGGAVGMSADERLQSLQCKPEMATLSTGTVNFGSEVFQNDQQMMETFAKRMSDLSVRPEFEIFDVGMINNALRLVSDGLVKGHLHFDFVLGIPGALPANAKNLVFLTDLLPAEASWTVAAMGRHQLNMAALAIVMGGNVRVGFEDNIYYKKGQLAKSNAELVERVVRLSDELLRPVATPAEARKILQLTNNFSS